MPDTLYFRFYQDGVIAGMVEKIWLSSEERLFRRSGVISGAKGNSGNKPKGIETKGQWCFLEDH